MPKGKPHPRLSSPDDDEDDTTPLCELKGVQAAKTAKTAAAAFKELREYDKLCRSRPTVSRIWRYGSSMAPQCALALLLRLFLLLRFVLQLHPRSQSLLTDPTDREAGSQQWSRQREARHSPSPCTLCSPLVTIAVFADRSD